MYSYSIKGTGSCFFNNSIYKKKKYREHEGEFQQIHRDMFPQKCVVSFHQFFFFLHLKCAFANILLISFIFNFKFMFCICIIAIDLIFVDFIFHSFHLEICKICNFILFTLKSVRYICRPVYPCWPIGVVFFLDWE